MASTCCSIILWLLGVGFFIASVVFDWGNFYELRKNDEEIKSTGIESCDFALDEYHWIFMAFVICKMISGIFEYVFGGLSLCEENEDSNGYDTASLVCNIFTTFFQALDLLLLVLFSYHCLSDDEIHHVRAFISDETDDFVAGVSGSAGLIFNLVIKKNTVTIFKAFIDIISVCCGKEKRYGESYGIQDPRTHYKVLTWISVLLIFVCIALVIALSMKL
ncbi:uncharacterized protein LOC132749518 [Ruditapes philippinarum]|uniref:uncharacterized protein LOC132749518 n=1 Tax=Ruditapes philippinarum TaxID=129788 RepID=UPI00295BE78A|nr:uncharacterized protein LOC132749518 [Ruditapes philippinarum]